MFARLFAVAALATFVVAQECTTGAVNCCDTTFQAEDAHSALSKLGINDLEGLTGLAASGCSPSSGLLGVGGSGSTCTQNPVCCNGNVFGGLISVGCSPIGISL